jgi:hypothetical protein
VPKFLSREELYRLFQRELPEDVYVDGPPTAGYSTASIDAKAKVFETAYANLERIYDNYFPAWADERQTDWEIKVFGEPLDASLSLAERRARVIAKLQKQPTITLWEILTLVAGYVPEGTFVQVVELSGNSGGGPWKLGVSKLGVDTALGVGDITLIPSGSECSAVVRDGWLLGISRLGLDTSLGGTKDWNAIAYAQIQAYAYIIRIFDYEITGDTLNQMISEIKRAEPARSGRFISQNENLATYGLVIPVTNVTQFDLVNCITRDPSSLTGYSGRKSV